MPKHHAFASRRLLRLDEVGEEPVAVLSRKDYADYHDWLRNTLGKTAKNVRVAEECDGAMSLIASVESGRAISFSAESIMSVAGGRLVFVRLSPAPEPLRVGVCYPKNTASDSATAKFVEAARSVAASMNE